MKKITILLCLLISGVAFSQQKSFTISWDGTKSVGVHDIKLELPFFQNENFSFDYETGLQYVAQWKSNEFVNEKTAQVTNVSYSTISKSDLKDLDVATIPNKIEFAFSNATARDRNSAILTLSPIIKDNGVYKKITSFTLLYGTRSNFSTRDSNDITNSVLRTGNWYRFFVERSGVHRLSKSFLEGLGVGVNNIDPRTIKIYGNGGQMVPLLNSEPQQFDPTENAIKLVGEDDGVFNDQDYILFYAEGPREFNQESNTNINAYNDKTYYYVNISSGLGKRIQQFNQPTATPDLVIDTFSDYQFHEEDEFNIVKLGRRWFGDRFSSLESERSFEFEFPNIVTTEPVKFRTYIAGISEVGTNMQISVNNVEVGNIAFQQIDDPLLADVDKNLVQDIEVNSPTISVDFVYNNNGVPSSQAFIDYIAIEATRQLAHTNGQFRFKNYQVAQNTGVAQYTISGANNVSEVWDITDKFNVSNAINTNLDSNYSFTSIMGSQRIYQAVDPSNFYEPGRDANTTVANQDIKGSIFNNEQGQFQDIDYIIVTPALLLSQANRLADINRQQYGLNIKVLTLNEIYAEFSTGNQDIGAIRNMVKYVYDNASTQENRLKYLCLFGDASYDYKDRITGNTNIVPSWHAYSSGNLTNSFVSDDFYGLMDDNEGAVVALSDRLDIAVGRMLADTPQRAKELVDKVQLYYEKESFGPWRNNLIFIADDVDASWEKVLQGTSNEIGDEVATEKDQFNVTKIYTDAFQQESSSGGDRYPAVSSAIADAIEVGALVVNYFGHGGEDGLAKERIFEQPDVQSLRNVCRFNCFVTITCEYTKFDNPQRPTAGEFTYWNKDGGAIALVTTTRQVFVTTGVDMNVALEKHLFSYGSNDYITIAEALRRTKQEINTPQRRLVFLIGDPAMKLSIPQPGVRLTSINDVPIGQNPAALEALGYAKISGEVIDEAGNVLTDYTGTLSATIYDKKIQRQTLANDGVTENGQLIILNFDTLGEVIFRGQASVTNGQFDFDFIVPRDIGIPEGNGRISFYAKAENILTDQAGSSTNIIIGGLNENAEEDTTGPTISLFMNDENFASGGITNESPTLLAKLEDEHGINTASGIGHDIVAIIDGDETNPFVLNDYYETELDVYQRGTLSYPFRDLEPGLHTLTLKAWDVYNNSSTADIQFVVFDKSKDLAVNNVLNYPNPFISYTEFWFNHNSTEPLDVSVQIFTVSGKLVKTINGKTKGGSKVSSSLSRELVWDGRDDFGDKIGKGVYVYKLTVKSNTLNKKVEKYEKLVIL